MPQNDRLEFASSTPIIRVVGYLKDEQGNNFEIIAQGTEDKVQMFMENKPVNLWLQPLAEYNKELSRLIEKLRKMGASQTTINSLVTDMLTQETNEPNQQNDLQLEHNRGYAPVQAGTISASADLGSLHIIMSLIEQVTPSPYVLHFDIDPPLSANPDYYYYTDCQVFSVECTTIQTAEAENGILARIDVSEERNNGNWLRKATNIVRFSQQATETCFWEVVVRGPSGTIYSLTGKGINTL